MSSRVSEFIILCEDDAQARLIRAFMERCKLRPRPPTARFEVASRKIPGGNLTWVISQFPIELRACRQRSTKAKTLLIVMIDADDETVDDRRRQLRASCEAADRGLIDETDVILVPRRNVETWLCLLADHEVQVDEVTDYKPNRSLEKADFSRAAEKLWMWSRPNAPLAEECPDSLRRALPEWRKIGS